MVVNIYIENKSGFDIPKYAHPGDSGLDIRAAINEPIKLGPLERYIFPTGLKVIIPEGYEIQVRTRSGMAAKRGLAVLNSPGTIDSCFRGEIGVILVNLSNVEQVIEPGERIAQLVVAPIAKAEIAEIDKVPDTTNRGEGAYGSSGDSKKIPRLLSMKGEERVIVDDDLVASIRQTIENLNLFGGSCIKLAFLETVRPELENGEWFNYQLLLEFPKAEDHIKYLGHEFLEIGHLLQKLESNIPENIMKEIDSIGVDEFDASQPNSYYLLLYILRDGKN